MKRFLRRRSSSSPTALIAGCVFGASIVGAPFETPTAMAGAPTQVADNIQTIALDGERTIYVKNARGKTIILGRSERDDVSIRATTDLEI